MFFLQEYTFTCGPKERTGKSYNQVKEAGLGQNKVIFSSSSDSYDNVKTVLLNEFFVDTAKYDVCLLGAQSNELNFETAHCYYQRQKEKYSGATRIYLDISPIWMQKQVSFEEVEFLLMTHKQKNEPSDANATIAPDNSSVAYGIDEKVLLFTHQNGKQYQRVHSRWGEFMLVPEKDVKQLPSFNAPDGTVLVIPPVTYISNNVCKLKNMELKVSIVHELWQLPMFVKTEYINWLCSIDFA